MNDPAPAANGYTVVASNEDGWQVTILDPRGTPVSERACASEEEARTYASTVRQHIYWLSEPKFRSYYKLAEPA